MEPWGFCYWEWLDDIYARILKTTAFINTFLAKLC